MYPLEVRFEHMRLLVKSQVYLACLPAIWITHFICLLILFYFPFHDLLFLHRCGMHLNLSLLALFGLQFRRASVLINVLTWEGFLKGFLSPSSL